MPNDPSHAPVSADSPLRYRVPGGEAQAELVVKNSRFIGTVAWADSLEAAHALVARVRARYPDASHHAWAFRLDEGPQATVAFSDDGEPGGTAGRPMLAMLEGSGLREVAVVGTRYFGGVKLGTGGLVRAYGGVAREALRVTPSVEYLLHRTAWIAVEYSLYGNLQYQLPRYQARVLEEQFAEQVRLLLAVPYDRAPTLATMLRDLSNGSVDLTDSWLEDRYLRLDG